MAEMRVPVYMRVGDSTEEFHVGDITCGPGEDAPSHQVPGVLRAVAAEIERLQDESALQREVKRVTAVLLSDEPGGDGA